jgi:SAM-dependent methyltransferase
MLKANYQDTIEYGLGIEAWHGYDKYLRDLIIKHQCKRICDVGGGANPAIDPQFVKAHGLDYVILDISESELKKAPPGYRTIIRDVTGDQLPESVFDLVISRMLAEHVRDAAVFHRNIFRMLMPGGRAFHFFPTLYAAPFVLNRLLPADLSAGIVFLLQSCRSPSGRLGKFPAYYDWCFGPIERQFRRLNSIGFQVEKYIGFFGHGSYYEKIPPIYWMHLKQARWLREHPIPYLTSFAYLVVRKPENAW